MTRRSREMANDLARRAIEAAERRAAAEGVSDEAAERLRNAAGPDGRLSVDAAIGALSDADRPPFNPFADPAYLERQAAKQQRDREALFGPEIEPEPEPTQPQGTANGGEGDDGEPVYEDVPGLGRMRVWPLNQSHDPKENDQ